MKQPYETHPDASQAISKRLKISRYINRIAFAAALGSGISLGYSTAEEPLIPDAASLAILAGAGAATGIDSKKALKSCEAIVKSYARSQSFRGKPENVTKVSIVEGELIESTNKDPDSSQYYRTRESAVQAEFPVATYAMPFATGGGGLLIANGISPEAAPPVAYATEISYLLGGTIVATGVAVAAARENYLKESEAAYLRQLDNIQNAGTIEF